jgi:hypothetical protein
MHVNVHVRFCSVRGAGAALLPWAAFELAGRCEGAGVGADRPPPRPCESAVLFGRPTPARPRPPP